MLWEILLLGRSGCCRPIMSGVLPHRARNVGAPATDKDHNIS